MFQRQCQVMNDLTLNSIEHGRPHVLNSVLEHHRPVTQATELLGVSERQAWRTLVAYREEDSAALAHVNLGRRPSDAASHADEVEYSGFVLRPDAADGAYVGLVEEDGVPGGLSDLGRYVDGDVKQGTAGDSGLHGETVSVVGVSDHGAGGVHADQGVGEEAQVGGGATLAPPAWSTVASTCS